MRLKAEIWVKSYVRRVMSEGAAAFIVHHGDDDAGSIFIRVNRLDGTSYLFAPAPAGLEASALDRRWCARFDMRAVADRDIDDEIIRERSFDADIWLIEVEDRAGRHFLDDWLA